MLHLLCRNRVKDYACWRASFDRHAEAQRAAGFTLLNVWRALEDANNVFFLFEVASVEQANAFMATPEAAAEGERSGVLEGDYHYLVS